MYATLRTHVLLYALPTLLAWSILFRGGKTLESVWLLVGVASVLTLLFYFDQKTKKTHAPVSRVIWVPLMFFVGLSWISFLASSTQNYGLDEMFQTSALALIFVYAYRGGIALPIERLLRFFGFVTVIACFIGLVVYIAEPVSRFVGTFLDMRFTTDFWPNAWANFLLLAWPIVLYGERKRHPDMEHLLLRGIVMGLIIGCLCLSYSRGAMIAFAGQIVLGVWMLWFRHTKKGAWRNHLEVLGFALITTFLVFFFANTLRSQFFPVQSVAEKVTFTATEGTSSIDERAQFWDQAANLTVMRPLLGWGPYSFRFVQPQFQTDVYATSDHPHNVFLKYAAERGVPAMLAFAFLLLIILVPAGNALLFQKKKKISDESGYLFIAVTGVIAHNLIDFNLQFIGIALPFWIFLALLAKQFAPATRPLKHSAIVQRNTEVVLACAILIIALIEGRFLFLSSLGRHAEAAGDTKAALYWYEQSKNELFSRDLHVSRAVLLADAGDLGQAQDALKMYRRQNNQDARAWRLQGDIDMTNGDIDAARMSYGAAYARNKWNDLSAVNAFLSVREDITNQSEELKLLFDRYLVAIENNTHFITLSDNVEHFEKFAEALAWFGVIEPEQSEDAIKRVQEKKRIERETFNAQSTGLLW